MKQTPESLVKFCQILSDLNIHDGNALGKQLNVSRTAIWKYVKRLQSYGIEINSSKGKGYQFSCPLYLIDQALISKSLKEEINIEVFETLPSTNDYLNNLTQDDQSVNVCISEQQTHGRGRFNREWFSPFGENIYCSISCQPDIDIASLGGLSLAIGIALAQAIEKCISLPNKLHLKWPNDLYYDDKKFGGVLIEAHAEANGKCRLVIGFGININMTDQHSQLSHINQDWTSLKKVTQSYHNRNPLMINIISELLNTIDKYQTNGLPLFMSKWNQRDYLYNKPIEVISGKTQIKGTAYGVNEFGHLQLKLEDGSIKTFSSGETSIKK